MVRNVEIDLGFIQRSIRVTLALTGLAFLMLSAYGRLDWAWGVGLGSVWACLNWLLIAALVRMLLRPGRTLSGTLKFRLAVLGLIKFPLLYLAGYMLLRLGFPVLSLLAGFWIILLVVVAKTVGRQVAGMDSISVPRGVRKSEGHSA